MLSQCFCNSVRLSILASALSILPFCVCLARSPSFIYVGLLAFLPDFIFSGMGCSWAWRRWILISFLGPFFLPGPCPMGLFQVDLWKGQSLRTWCYQCVTRCCDSFSSLSKLFKILSLFCVWNLIVGFCGKAKHLIPYKKAIDVIFQQSEDPQRYTLYSTYIILDIIIYPYYTHVYEYRWELKYARLPWNLCLWFILSNVILWKYWVT